jgi:hypothetical protein
MSYAAFHSSNELGRMCQRQRSGQRPRSTSRRTFLLDQIGVHGVKSSSYVSSYASKSPAISLQAVYEIQTWRGWCGFGEIWHTVYGAVELEVGTSLDGRWKVAHRFLRIFAQHLLYQLPSIRSRTSIGLSALAVSERPSLNVQANLGVVSVVKHL